MHGYQLSRELTQALGGFWRVSYGSLYPILRRLERNGAIVSQPPEQPAAGRRRNVYRITEFGEVSFLEQLQETPHDTQTEDTRFRVRLAFFRYLPPETRLRLLERRRASLEDRLTSISESLRAARERVDDYALALMQHGRDSTASDIAWLDGLIEAERDRDGRRGGKRRGQGRTRKRRAIRDASRERSTSP